MTPPRTETIAQAISEALRAQPGRGVEDIDVHALAQAVDAALANAPEARAVHDEGRRPEDLNSANDG